MAFVGTGLGAASRSPFPSRFGTVCRRGLSMVLATGTRIPLEKDVMTLKNGKPTPVSLSSVFADKKVVMFTIPGALTPTCTDSHAPAYLDKIDELKAKGVDEIVCLSVNDPFVLDAYAKKLNAGDSITFLADGNAAIVKELGVDFDTGGFGGIRATRASYIVDDGVFTHVNMEEGGGYAGPSKVDTILAQL